MAREVKARRLEGKVAVVTAATKGIGLAIARRLAQEGASVVISSRNEKNVKEVVAHLKAEGLRVEGVLCHVANPEHRQNLLDFTLKTFGGRVHILVNNAGINPAFGDILEVSDDVWDKLFDVNVKAGFVLTKLFVPHIEKSGGGSVIFNSSYSAYKSPPGIGAYGVTKTALVGLTKALSLSLAKYKIRVNGIAPGIIKTKLSSALWDTGDGEGEKHAVENQEVVLGRLGEPEDCAGVVAFLVSDDADYVTGEMVVVGGGVQARL